MKKQLWLFVLLLLIQNIYAESAVFEKVQDDYHESIFNNQNIKFDDQSIRSNNEYQIIDLTEITVDQAIPDLITNRYIITQAFIISGSELALRCEFLNATIRIVAQGNYKAGANLDSRLQLVTGDFSEYRKTPPISAESSFLYL